MYYLAYILDTLIGYRFYYSLQEEESYILLGPLCTLTLKTSLFYIILNFSHFYSCLLLQCHNDKTTHSKKVCCYIYTGFLSFFLSFIFKSKK